MRPPLNCQARGPGAKLYPLHLLHHRQTRLQTARTCYRCCARARGHASRVPIPSGGGVSVVPPDNGVPPETRAKSLFNILRHCVMSLLFCDKPSGPPSGRFRAVSVFNGVSLGVVGKKYNFESRFVGVIVVARLLLFFYY